MLGTIKNGHIFSGFSVQKEEEEVKERDPWSPVGMGDSRLVILGD